MCAFWGCATDLLVVRPLNSELECGSTTYESEKKKPIDIGDDEHHHIIVSSMKRENCQ